MLKIINIFVIVEILKFVNMNVKLRVLSAGVLFFIGQSAMAQKKKVDTTSVKDIEEVVVVAFGKQKKEAIVGSVAKIDSKVLANQQATSVLSALQGTVSGVNIVTSSAQPGDSPNIYIRGISSINASTQPLIILDGAPFGGNINSISQDQVESMTVLKDASASALYGSRAANGVIIITTKKGKLNSRPKVSITSLVGASGPAVPFHKTMGADDFMKYTWQAIKNNQLYTNGATDIVASQYATDNIISLLGYNPYGVNKPIGIDGKVVNGANLLWDTDWRKYLIDDFAFKQESRFNITGGSENTTYFVGADYLNTKGGLRTSEFERVTVRANVDSKVNNWLQVGVNSSFATSFQNSPTQSGASFQSPVQWIYNVPNIYPLYMRDEKGNLILDSFGKEQYDYGASGASGRLVNAVRDNMNNENAVGALYNYKRYFKRSDVVINGYAQTNLTDYLNLRSQLSYQMYLYDTYAYSSNQYGNAASVRGRVSQNRDIAKTINWTNSLNFNKSFGDHNINAQAIFEIMDYKYDGLGAAGTGFLPNVFVLNGKTVSEGVSGYVNQERLVSYLGRAGYNYKNKYFIEGSFRADGSSRFASENRWGKYYSVGGAYILSAEDFFKNDIVNYLKFKGSYGELGNNKTQNSDGSQNYFPYMMQYDTGWNQLGATGILLLGPVDYNLRWEKTAATNVGVEFGLFNNRITGNVEYWNKKSVDLIYNKPLPISTGNSSIITNVGAIRNYGVDIDLTSVNIAGGNIEWRTNLNLSFAKNKITELTQKSFINGNKRWEVGKSIYDFFVPEWAGVDSQTGMGTWWYNKKDANGNVTRDKTADYNVANLEANKIYAGSSLPDVTGGLNNYLRIGNFDLNALFNFSFGGYIYDSTYASLMSGFSAAGRQQSVDVMNAWQKPGDISDIPVNIMKQNNNNATSTRFLFKNNYIRLKALTLGYNVDPKLFGNMEIKGLRLFIQGDNLWTWQSHKGIDPEQSINGNTDSRSYNLRTVSMGFTLNF